MSQEQVIAELETKVDALERALARLLRLLANRASDVEVTLAAGEALNVLLGDDE